VGDPVKTEIPAGTLGFSFRMRANGVGGTFPKTYAVDGSNLNLTGLVTEFAPILFPGWPSDPGDNIFPTFSRDYGPANGGVVADGLCPNNVRLSQVPLSSIVASYGIAPGIKQRNLPTSSNYNNPNFSTVPGAVNTLGNFCGIKSMRLQVLDPWLPFSRDLLVNGGFAMSNFGAAFEIDMSNMGAVTVVNLRSDDITVGVTMEMDI